jgi:methylmalonyl-CoA/ethylmalonyl-CoA epimerase
MLSKSFSTLYHPCYEVENINSKVQELYKNGFRILHNIAAAPAIGVDAKVVFMHSLYTGVIELVQLE